MMSPIDPLKNALPSLEQATQLRPLFLLTSFVIFLDCASVYCCGKNIIHLSSGVDMSLQQLAVPVLLALILFGFLSIILRVLKNFADIIVVETVWRLWNHIQHKYLLQEHRTRKFYYDTVPLSQISAKAHKTKEPYYLSLLKEAEEKRREYEALSQGNALGAFSVIVLSIFDVSGFPSGMDYGIIPQFLGYPGQYAYFMFFIMYIFIIAVAFYPVFHEYTAMVYCPELAEELNAELKG